MESPLREGSSSPCSDSAATSCNVCGKLFKTRFALKQHYKVHYVEKKYACSSCSKRFATKGCLEIHELSHSSDICKLCGNSFSHSSGSRNPKNLCDMCSKCSSSPETTSYDQQLAYSEEEFSSNQLDSSSRKERRTYISDEQKLKIVEFMEEHPIMIKNQVTESFTTKDRQLLWEELRIMLNSERDGRIKNVAQWKKCWNDLKSSVKERAAKIKAERGVFRDSDLSQIDRRLFALAKLAATKEPLRTRDPPKREGLRDLSVRVIIPKLQPPDDFKSVEEIDEMASASRDLHSFTSTPNISSNSSNMNNQNGLRNRDKKVLFPAAEMKDTKAAVISLAETSKETLQAFKRIAAAQEKLVALHTKRNEEQRHFESRLLLMVEGLLNQTQEK